MVGETGLGERVGDPDAGVPQPGSDAVPGAGSGAVGSVAGFRSWLASVDVEALSDRERVDLVAELERVKGAAAAAQARATDALRCSVEVSAPRDVGRSVGSQVALARRVSPALGDRFVGLARALVHEMPHTMAALSGGVASERHAVAVVAATATLTVEHRAEVDRRVGPGLGRLGVAGAAGAAARVAAELDAAGVVARMAAAVSSRRVSVRPAPDGMAYLSVLGPLRDVVGAHAALQARSRAVLAGQCPGEDPQGRGVGAVAADTALRLLSGRAAGEVTPVEVHLVLTDRALLGTGDPDPLRVRAGAYPGARQRPGAGGPLLAARRRPGVGVAAPAVHHPVGAGPGRHGLAAPGLPRVVAPDAGAARRRVLHPVVRLPGGARRPHRPGAGRWGHHVGQRRTGGAPAATTSRRPPAGPCTSSTPARAGHGVRRRPDRPERAATTAARDRGRRAERISAASRRRSAAASRRPGHPVPRARSPPRPGWRLRPRRAPAAADRGTTHRRVIDDPEGTASVLERALLRLLEAA